MSLHFQSLLRLVCLPVCLVIFIVGELFMSGQARAGKFIVDDFEYWDSPYNHGWKTSDYAYPVYGYEIGYGRMQTVVDFQEGSRVFEAFYTPSIFNNLEPYSVAKLDLTDPNTGHPPVQRYFTAKVQTDFAVEAFAFLRLSLLIKTTSGLSIRVSYLPVDGDKPWVSDSKNIQDPFGLGNIEEILFPIGREFQDGGWHWVIRDLKSDLEKMAESGIVDSTDKLEQVYGIIISGNHFRVDEIIFQDDIKEAENRFPFIWYPGPQFATLFQPFELILYADDKEGDPITWTAMIGGIPSGSSTSKLFIEPLPPDPNQSTSDGRPPARARLSFTPQVLEDLIIVVRISDGLISDATVFPLSVVNYPVTNHPPLVEKNGLNCKLVAPVGERFQYQVRAYDQDNDPLTFKAFLSGFPTYQYGPWVENIINPKTGLIDFTPQFEGTYTLTIIAYDDKWMWSSASWTLVCYIKGAGWLNHPPIRARKPLNPQICRAGRSYVLPICMEDPDGDHVYYSSNIGAISEDGVFSFLTYFPGRYNVKITGYDNRGGIATLTFTLIVVPWWLG